MKDREHAAALRHLARHPAHGDRKTAAAVSLELANGRSPRRGELRAFLRDPGSRWLVTPRAVTGWRNDAGLAPAVPSAHGHRPPRRVGVRLGCGHGLGAPAADPEDAHAWCWRCHAWQPIADEAERKLFVNEEASRRLAARIAATPPLPPDSAPAEPESQKHFVDRPAAEVAREVLERIFHGPLPSDPRRRLAEALRRGGMDREEAERIAVDAFPARRTQPRRG